MKLGAPQSWPGDVFSWLWDNEPSEMEDTDGQPAYPSDEAVKSALEALELLEEGDDEE